MRSDYALYVVAIIFFVITGISFALVSVEFERNLSVVATAILGLLSAGFGFTLRPKPTTIADATNPPTVAPTPIPPPPDFEPVATTNATIEVKIEETQQAVPVVSELTNVKGIGGKRAQQLGTIGISNIDELSKASAKELASKLQISPKITGKWIANAKELVKKP